jgi:urease accessory protein
MKEFTQLVIDALTEAPEKLVLTFQQRQKSRLKVTLASGEEVGLILPRGTVLKEGDIVASEAGEFIRISAAVETVSTITSGDAHLLLRIAYHLGNRHVPLQVESGWLRYAHDHVLDEMVTLLGGKVSVTQASLQPEKGAYGGGHKHAHEH